MAFSSVLIHRSSLLRLRIPYNSAVILSLVNDVYVSAWGHGESKVTYDKHMLVVIKQQGSGLSAQFLECFLTLRLPVIHNGLRSNCASLPWTYETTLRHSPISSDLMITVNEPEFQKLVWSEVAE